MRKPKFIAIVAVIACLLMISGAVIFADYKNQDSAKFEPSNSPTLQTKPEDNKLPTDAAATNNVQNSPMQTPSTPTTGTTYKPATLSKCTWVDEPFKYIFIKSSHGSVSGINGTRENCTHSDGSKTSKVVREPDDQVVAINVTAQDKANIDKICNAYPAEYYDSCAAVVRYDP